MTSEEFFVLLVSSRLQRQPWTKRVSDVSVRKEHRHKLILESLKILFVGDTKQPHFVGVTSDLCTCTPLHLPVVSANVAASDS
jgi:hypothetical protein